ncbi:hypothetical protein JD292_06535 [Leucobacter sp. CSA2]|uniref:Lipoprotein n=1 Tax=Leucobacter edaphi TaxID=2796472 RepID=A0A934UXV4_9MICO|nr:hypothetical protein [Leucobacter edaphi]MBK0421728.1 hypothetical protein [Leucobacter edaphi]
MPENWSPAEGTKYININYYDILIHAQSKGVIWGSRQPEGSFRLGGCAHAMRVRSKQFILAATIGMLFATGCTMQGKAEMASSKNSNAREHQLNQGLTWEKAKADTQETERQIAGLVPKELVDSVKQKGAGMLFQCSNGQHQWNGEITVKLRPDAAYSTALKALERHYETAGGDYSASIGDDGFGSQWLTIVTSRNDGENYLVSTGHKEHQLRIDSSSPCFTLPEDVYPGGDF